MILRGDCLEQMRTLSTGSVQTCVTSPPYFGLRDYGCEGQIGLEPTPDEFVAKLVEVFREVRRLLRDDGTLWLNLGDSYAGGGCGSRNAEKWPKQSRNDHMVTHGKRMTGLEAKQLLGIPWRVAFALQLDGWYLRQDIIWSKPNPMPESVTDRCAKAHEYLFLLSKEPCYYFDHESIKEPVAASSVARLSQDVGSQAGSNRVPGKTNGPMKAVRSKANSFKREGSKREQSIPGQTVGTHRPDRAESKYGLDTRNKRSVWTISTMPFRDAHFATFPERLIEPCILAGAPAGATVLDPFMGAGTTAVVCERLGRKWVGCELNSDYAAIAEARIRAVQPGLSFGACV